MEYTKYNIEEKRSDVSYTTHRIEGLFGIYHSVNERMDVNDEYNGAAGLLRNSENPGYCNLCGVYHERCSERFDNGYTVHFFPLCNKEGKRILLKHGSDDTFVMVYSNGYNNFNGNKVESEIVFCNNGSFDGSFEKD